MIEPLNFISSNNISTPNLFRGWVKMKIRVKKPNLKPVKIAISGFSSFTPAFKGVKKICYTTLIFIAL
jgi:hypothetical protein